MNRRSFFKRLTLGAAAFTILPGAGRVWKAERLGVLAQLDGSFVCGMIPPGPKETLYDYLLDIRRQREKSGQDPKVIEIITDKPTGDLFRLEFERYQQEVAYETPGTLTSHPVVNRLTPSEISQLYHA